MKISITLSANAGVSLEIGGYKIWVDALHTRKQPGFSAVDGILQKRMQQCSAFEDPDVIAFTHCHPDHFSEALTKEAVCRWPRAAVCLPEGHFADQVLISGNPFVYRTGDLTLQFMRLPHEGELYASCVHYGLLVFLEDKCILLPGDCRTADTTLGNAIAGYHVDLALLNFPWLTLKRGQKFIRDVIRPAHTLVYHLPFAEDDSFAYRDAAQRALKKQPVNNASLLWDPLQTVELEL